MNELISTRTLPVIATEINSIKDQTRKLILCSSIEIGRRLMEAKSLVAHGEWGNWLKESVDYSQRTASNLMRIFEEYGAQQIPLFGDNSKSQALANLSYTQAVALLEVPQEEREEFIKNNDLDNMTTRELQQAIKAQKDAENRAAEAEKRADELAKSLEQARTKAAAADDLEEENTALKDSNKNLYDELKTEKQRNEQLQEELEKERNQAKEEAERLETLLDEAKQDGSSDEKVQELESELKKAQAQVNSLTEQINKPVTLEPAVVEKIPEDIERELNELKAKNQELESKLKRPDNAVLKFGVYFDTLVSDFKNLLSTLAEISDPEANAAYKKAVLGLIGKMSEKLG